MIIDVNWLLEMFSNREKAIGTWLIVFIGWILFSEAGKKIQKSFVNVLKAFLNIKIIMVLITMLFYCTVTVFT